MCISLPLAAAASYARTGSFYALLFVLLTLALAQLVSRVVKKKVARQRPALPSPRPQRHFDVYVPVSQHFVQNQLHKPQHFTSSWVGLTVTRRCRTTTPTAPPSPAATRCQVCVARASTGSATVTTGQPAARRRPPLLCCACRLRDRLRSAVLRLPARPLPGCWVRRRLRPNLLLVSAVTGHAARRNCRRRC